MTTTVYTDYIDKETKRKALFVLKTQGTSLSKEVAKILVEKAKEFDNMKK